MKVVLEICFSGLQITDLRIKQTDWLVQPPCNPEKHRALVELLTTQVNTKGCNLR